MSGSESIPRERPWTQIRAISVILHRYARTRLLSVMVYVALHLDLTSSAVDRHQEIDRLLALGARRVDIGQSGTESWTVLADPEGNEFCVLRPKLTLVG